MQVGALIHDYQGGERSDQESASDGNIALAKEHNWAPIISTSSRGVARTIARRLRLSGPGREFLRPWFASIILSESKKIVFAAKAIFEPDWFHCRRLSPKSVVTIHFCCSLWPNKIRRRSTAFICAFRDYGLGAHTPLLSLHLRLDFSLFAFGGTWTPYETAQEAVTIVHICAHSWAQ